MKVDKETGELIAENVMPLTDKAPAIIIDVSEVQKYNLEPGKLVEKINAQAGYMVFDVKTQTGRDACRAHAAQIIKCIAPAIKESKRLADEAKKIVNQDISFRRIFEAGVREIADYHRKPLTEWELEQDRIAEQERIFAEKLEALRCYQIDWDDAIAFNELFNLRKEKALRDAELEAVKNLAEQEEYDKHIQAQAVERERERQERTLAYERQKMAQEAEQQHQRLIEEAKKEKQRIIDEYEAKKINITTEELKKLQDDSATLRKIVELWKSSDEMMEAAQRSESISVMRKEEALAKGIREQAINIIKSLYK